ncbi:MAG: leucine-rich repeat domain-containing protein, partial [Prevotella sp.]|nr:leucine-rich repeat domain-containing protein [Prevotella sp.]
LLTVLLSMVGANVFAHDIEVENDDSVTIYYNFINDGTELEVTYRGEDYYDSDRYTGNVAIPESATYNGTTYSVTSIGDHAFFYCWDLTSVTIGNNVTSIRDSAFSNCKGLISVTIGNNVNTIRVHAFSWCSSLTSITVADGNSVYDSRNNCNAIIETASNQLIAGCQNTTIPNDVTCIGSSAFRGCITSLSIPNNVKHIEGYAFSDCTGLTEVTIPNSVTYIGGSAFSGCSGLTSIIVEDGNTVYDSRNNCNAIIETATNTLLTGCKNTTIPNDITSIESQAFMYCELTSIIIPNNVTSIGINAFSGCKKMTSITIGNNVTSIGSSAFRDCTSLASITIPNSVTSIDYGAFDGCYNLKSVMSLIEEPFTIDKDVFLVLMGGGGGMRAHATLYVPQGTKEKYLATEGWADNFVNIVEMDHDDITLGAVGKGTYCSNYDLDFTDVDGLKAYIASGYDYATGTVLLTNVKEVPAGTGVMLMGTEGTYQVPYCSEKSQYYYLNMLKGTLNEQPLPQTEDGYTNYIFANGADGWMFYLSSGNGNIPAHKAYLQIPTVAAEARPMLNFVIDDETTGTDDALMNNVESTDGKVYNLNGQRVEQPKQGIYIQNGKKVIIR